MTCWVGTALSQFIRTNTSSKDRLFEWRKAVSHKVGAVRFGIIWKSVCNVEVCRILYDRQHELLPLNIESRLCGTSSLDRVHIQRGDVLNTNQDLSPVTRWCQPSRSAAHRNDNITFACSFHFWHKPSVNRCGTRRKWTDLKPIDTFKWSNTVARPTHSLSVLEQVDSEGDLCDIANIFVWRSSRGGLPVRISSWRYWHRTVPQQSRIEPFEACRHVHQTVLKVWL
jgi:hypothetical protein